MSVEYLKSENTNENVLSYSNIMELKEGARFIKHVPNEKLLEFAKKVCPWISKGKIRWDKTLNDNPVLLYRYVEEGAGYYSIFDVYPEFIALKFHDYACVQRHAGRKGEINIDDERNTEEYNNFIYECLPDNLKQEFLKGLDQINEYYQKEEDEEEELC